MTEENTESTNSRQARAAQVQKHLRPEDKKWLKGVVAGLIIGLVAVIAMVISLFFGGWNVVSWVSLGCVVLGIGLMIVFSVRGVKHLESRGLNVAQIGYDAVHGSGTAPQTILEAEQQENTDNEKSDSNKDLDNQTEKR